MKTGVMMLAITEINYTLNIYCNNLSQYYCIFYQINVGLIYLHCTVKLHTDIILRILPAL